MYFFCKLYCASLNEFDMAEAQYEQMFNALNNNQVPNIDTNNNKEQNDENQSNNQQKKNLIDKEYWTPFYQKLNTLSQEHFSVLNFEEIKKFFNENRDKIEKEYGTQNNLIFDFDFGNQQKSSNLDIDNQQESSDLDSTKIISTKANIFNQNLHNLMQDVCKINMSATSITVTELKINFQNKQTVLKMQYKDLGTNMQYLIETKNQNIARTILNSEKIDTKKLKTIITQKILKDFDLLFTLNNDKNLNNQQDLSNQPKNEEKHGYQSVIIVVVISGVTSLCIAQFIK